MKKIIRFFGLASCLFLIPFVGFSQLNTSATIDSLRKELKIAKDDITRVDVLSELCYILPKVDSLASFKTGFEALELSRKIKYKKGEAAALFSLGGAFMDYFDLDKADQYYDRGFPIINAIVQKDSSKANLKIWLRGYYGKAINYSYRSNPTKEIEWTDKVIPIAQKINDLDFLTNVHTNLGILKMNVGQNNDAYTSLKKSEQINNKLKAPKRIIFTNLTIAGLLHNMDSIIQMKPYLDAAKKYLDKDLNSIDWQLYYTNEAQYFSGLNQYEKAIASLDKAKVIILDKQLNQEYFLLMQRYASVCQKHGDYPAAIKYMTEFIKTATDKKIPLDRFKGYYKRSQYEAAQENYKNAYNDYVLAIDIYDSLETENHLKNIKELELKYDSAEKEKEILALTVKNEQKKSQTYLLLGLASVLGLLLFTGYYIYNQRLRKARKKEHLHESEINLLKQEQQNKIFSAMIEGQEKERKRLAIDLHDGLGGRLSGISLNLSKLDKDEPKEYPKQQLQKVMKDLGDALTELRAIARNMMPETLVKFGLEAALKDYCSSMTGNETKVMLQFYGNEKGMNINQQVTIYRVIQELINNAIKHANASEVLVQYIREGNKVDITVEDNGIGFNLETTEEFQNGMGISNLKTRVAYLKGCLDFHSEENEGTTVNINIIIDAA
ncbi:tetratricopeptide repeat-containing sensor histidine kinase [Cellulophaga tyrosinoxydans]|uniref:histidine kinase n=1 Tax=Cellulophaga tyrosinoxydans TaxID=504486 RepID=A0A1W2BI38_9FLAO|nr:sensor histidine kinase [Cellulophaga tyrosinoxydans]SMC72541.1 Signal transduction histidine kinase [Cellulophaga tyrosinoxydans]